MGWLVEPEEHVDLPDLVQIALIVLVKRLYQPYVVLASNRMRPAQVKGGALL